MSEVPEHESLGDRLVSAKVESFELSFALTTTERKAYPDPEH